MTDIIKQKLFPMLIVSIRKFSILIGSTRAYLSRSGTRSRGYPITGIQFDFEQLQIGYLLLDTFAIRAPITHAKMGSFRADGFAAVCIGDWTNLWFFHTKEVLKDFPISIFFIDTIQFRGNRACNFKSALPHALGRFQITRSITPWIKLHSVLLPSLTAEEQMGIFIYLLRLGFILIIALMIVFFLASKKRSLIQ